MADHEAARAHPDDVREPLARGREKLLQQQKAKTEGLAAATATQARRREFDEIVRPLEEACGERLAGPGRGPCWTAFGEHPHGFRACAAAALDRGKRPPGLLIQMVRDGDHRDVLPPYTHSSTWARAPCRCGAATTPGASARPRPSTGADACA
jgi:hypothetical protein